MTPSEVVVDKYSHAGDVEALKQRIHRQQVPAYKVGPVWLVRESTLPRPVRQRSPGKDRKRQGYRLAH